MARRLPEELSGRSLAPLCVAVKPAEARAVEAVLDRAGIDYTFEITEVMSRSFLRIFFGTPKKGVMFLVPEEHYEFSRGLFEKNGISHLLV